MRPLVVSLLLVAAVLVLPQRQRVASASAALGVGTTAGTSQAFRPGVVQAVHDVWHDDPVEVCRRWRLRRRPADVIAGALALLDATEPALVAGLSPGKAIDLAVAATSGMSPDGRLGVDLSEAATSGASVSKVWAGYADRTRSREIAFVAAAWRLSEDTGAPLALAVSRAAAGLREARTRQRKVAVAVAGPRATVAVLTVLPLTGPLFGLACGVGPAELYLDRPIGAVSVVLGLVLIALGRLWCRRMIRAAVTP
jgi:tight adherence protein B